MFAIAIDDAGGLELWLDGCLRKRCEPGEREPLYVWTNIELDWEDHHYVEARYFHKCGHQRGKLNVTINGESILKRRLPPQPPSESDNG